MNASEINSIIDNLASKLGVATEFLNETLLEQAKIQILESSIWTVLSIAMCIFILAWFHMMVKKNEDGVSAFDKADKSWRFSLCFCTVGAFVYMAVAFVIFAVVAVYNASKIITCAFNPQWYAIEKILGMLNSK